MDLPDLSSLLPPGLLGLGGIIPILIGRNPFTEDEKVKPLLATVVVLMVWLVYLSCLLLFRQFLFSQYWALVFVGSAMICLGLLLRDMLFPPVVPPPPTPEAAFEQAEQARRRTTLLYTGGLVSAALAASILAAMQGWVVIDVKLEGEPAKLRQSFEQISLRKSDRGEPVKLPVHKILCTRPIVRVLVAQKDFESTTDWDYLYMEGPAQSGQTDKTTLYLTRAQMAQIIMPGAGVFMEGEPTSTHNHSDAANTAIENHQDP
jgi:hypothetical protein